MKMATAINRTKKVSCQFVVSRGNGSILLEFGKEIFNQMSGFVQVLVVISERGAVAFRRNHHCLALRREVAQSLACLHRSPCPQAPCLLPNLVTVDRRHPGRTLVPVSGENSRDCPMHPPWHESWYSVHLCCVQLLPSRVPPSCARTVLVSADDR